MTLAGINYLLVEIESISNNREILLEGSYLNNKKSRLLKVAVTLLGVIIALTSFPQLLEAKEVNNSIERISGLNRYETSLQVALKSSPATIQNVVLASGNNFPDALAGVPLAFQKNAPLLLVDAIPESSKDTLDYIKTHLEKEGTIYILGGTAVIPDTFIKALTGMGYKYEKILRLGGIDRYETSLAIARELQHDGTQFFIATGDNYPDALSASVMAAIMKSTDTTKGVPMLLIPSSGQLPDSFIKYLNELSLPANQLQQSFNIIGGTGAVPELYLTQLQNLVKRTNSLNIVRYGGANRYETSNKVNTDLFAKVRGKSELNVPVSEIYLATGENFPDALSGAVLAARNYAPMVLIDDSFPTSTQELLFKYFGLNNQGNVSRSTISILGGTGVISENMVVKTDYVFNYGQMDFSSRNVQTLAGAGVMGFKEGDLLDAEFAFPSGLAINKNGTVYISDTKNHRIRVIDGDQVRTLAGYSKDKNSYGLAIGGYQDGNAETALFNQPRGLALADNGVLYVADSGNGCIRAVDTTGTVSTLLKGLNYPTDLVIGPSQEIYVTETLNHRILKVLPNGQWSVLAGGGNTQKDSLSLGDLADGKGETAKFNEPTGLALGQNGLLYVADSGNQRIRTVSQDGLVTTLAGSGLDSIPNTNYKTGGFLDGSASIARFNFPSSVTVDMDGAILVADAYNHRIRKISSDGQVSTVAGTGKHGKQNGFLEQCQFDGPVYLRLTPEGTLIIVDQLNHQIRTLNYKATE